MKQALIIIDVQNDYFEGGNMELVGMEDAAGNSSTLLDRFRREQSPVYHIQHIATREGATFFLPDTRGSEIHESVRPQEGESVVVKHVPNAFRNTELNGLLQDSNIKDVIVCGAMTHMCVDTTVRAAFDLGYKCTVIADACATRDLEYDGRVVKAAEVQTAFMAALSMPFAGVVTTREFLRARPVDA